MSEGMTCYERDETLCEDQMCLRVGCRLRNKRLEHDLASVPALVKALEETAVYLDSNAERLTDVLANSSWAPRRSHTEGDRNTMISASNTLRRALAAYRKED